MEKLTPEQKEFWQEYLSKNPDFNAPDDVDVSADMAGNTEITDELIELYISGKKTAGSSLKESYICDGDPLPEVDQYWIVLDSNQKPKCLLKTVKIETYKYLDVPEKVAIAEGEGDLSLEYWRKVHGQFFTPYLAECGLSKLEDATIITEYFELVYRV